MTSSSPLTQSGRPLLFYIVLVIVSTVSPLAMNIFVPFIPGLMREFSASSGAVQWTLTVYLAGIAISQLFYGPLSDMYGRRPVMLAGLMVYVLASFLCAMAWSIETLMAGRFLQAVGGAAGMVLGRAIVRDVHDRETSASVLGYITTAWVLVPMFAPAVGGLIDQVSTWRTVFYLIVGFGLAVTVLVIMSLPETNAGSGRSTRLLGGVGKLVREPGFIGITAVLAFSSAVFFTFIAASPFIMINVLGQSALEYGLWFLMVSVGYMTGNFISGRYSQRIGIEKMVSIGNFVTIAGAGIMLAFGASGNLSPVTLFGPMLICTFGNGLVIPNATAAAISVLPGTIGAAAGISGFMQVAFGASMSQLSGVLQGGAPLAGLWIIAASAVLAGVAHHATMHMTGGETDAASSSRT